MKKFLSILTSVGVLATSASTGILSYNNLTGINQEKDINNKYAEIHYWLNVDIDDTVEVASIGKAFQESTAFDSTTAMREWDFFQKTNVVILDGLLDWHNSIEPITYDNAFLFDNKEKSSEFIKVYDFDETVTKELDGVKQSSQIKITLTAEYDQENAVTNLKLESYISASTEGWEKPCSTTIQVKELFFFHL